MTDTCKGFQPNGLLAIRFVFAVCLELVLFYVFIVYFWGFLSGLFSMFNPCTTLFRVYKEHSVTTWTYTYCILEIACNKFSYKEWMCSWKKTPVVHFSSAPTSRKRPVNLHILSGCFWAVQLYYYQSYHHHQSSIINHQ